MESIPRRFLEAILRELTRHGLLTSSRGRSGGYALRAPAAEISVASVVRILDGSALTFPCLSPRGATRCAECAGTGVCPGQLAFAAMDQAALQALESISIAELIGHIDRAAELAIRTQLPSPARKADDARRTLKLLAP